MSLTQLWLGPSTLNTRRSTFGDAVVFLGIGRHPKATDCFGDYFRLLHKLCNRVLTTRDALGMQLGMNSWRAVGFHGLPRE